MCRSIKKLRKPEGIPTNIELYEASRQFIRKISGFREPSKVHQEAFEEAINEVSEAARSLLETMDTSKKRKVLVNEK
jgi:hypothetical protein